MIELCLLHFQQEWFFFQTSTSLLLIFATIFSYLKYVSVNKHSPVSIRSHTLFSHYGKKTLPRRFKFTISSCLPAAGPQKKNMEPMLS
jgi:hypothetical protein